MTWPTDMIIMLRHLIDDLSATPTYSDDRLKQLTLVSAILVANDMELTTGYTVDLTGLTISPDPMADEDYSNLIILKSACLLSETDLRSNACKFLKVKDDKSYIDNTAAMEVYKTIYSGKNGPCALYQQALTEFQINQISNIGRAIMTPIRTQMYSYYIPEKGIVNGR